MSNFVVNPYRFVAESVEFCQSNSNTASGFKEDEFRGNVIVSGNSVIGASCTALTLYISGESTPEGTIYARVYNDSGVLQHTWNSINSSSGEWIDGTITAFTFTGSAYTIQEDDRVGLEADMTQGLGEIAVSTSAQTGWERIERNDGSWSTPTTTVAIKMCITGIAA